MKKIHTILSIIFLVAISCSDDGLKFNVKPSVGFEATSGSVLENNASGIRVKLYSNVDIKETATVTIALNNFQNLQYGVDFTTEPEFVYNPESESNEITLTLEPQGELPSFFVYPTFKGVDRYLGFQLTDIEGGDVVLASSLALSYSLTIKSLGCPSGVTPVTVTHDFNTCTTDFVTPTGFIEVFEPGSKTDRGWGCRGFGLSGTRAVRASANAGTPGEDRAWMIMNPIRIAATSDVRIRFSVFSNFAGLGTVKVKWSSDYSGSGNPLLATWTDLSVINNQFPAPGSAAWKEINEVFTNICGDNVYIGFQFAGGTNSNSSSWDIDDLSVVVD